MYIISFCATKGGVGKSSLSQNFAEWLASKGFKVLLIDADHQANITQYYEIYDNEHTIQDVFAAEVQDRSAARIREVSENLYLLPSSTELEKTEQLIQGIPMKELLLSSWLIDASKTTLQGFDYIIIDTHPDFSTITQNVIAASDIIISPVEPSEYGYNGIFNLETRFEKFKSQLVDFKDRTEIVTAKLFFLANKIKKDYNSSKNLLLSLEGKENALPYYFPQRELVNTCTLKHVPLVKAEENSKIRYDNKEFFEQMHYVFENIRKLAEEV